MMNCQNIQESENELKIKNKQEKPNLTQDQSEMKEESLCDTETSLDRPELTNVGKNTHEWNELSPIHKKESDKVPKQKKYSIKRVKIEEKNADSK